MALPRLVLLSLLASMTTSCVVNQTGDTPMHPFEPSSQIQPATAVLHEYEAALNRADVDTIASLYAADAVFMAQHRQPAIGEDQIRAAYSDIFTQIRLAIRFEIDEVEIVTPTVAYARTRSAGTTTIVANGAEIAEANQELFILGRADERSEWRIERYIFSTTQPMVQP